MTPNHPLYLSENGQPVPGLPFLTQFVAPLDDSSDDISAAGETSTVSTDVEVISANTSISTNWAGASPPGVEFEYSSQLECIICSDRVVDSERVKILFCGHLYHTFCIDKWLTQYNRVCPSCRKPVQRPI
jgi:hypothetical protein